MASARQTRYVGNRRGQLAAQIEDNLQALENASFSDDELARIDALSRE